MSKLRKKNLIYSPWESRQGNLATTRWTKPGFSFFRNKLLGSNPGSYLIQALMSRVKKVRTITQSDLLARYNGYGTLPGVVLETGPLRHPNTMGTHSRHLPEEAANASFVVLTTGCKCTPGRTESMKTTRLE